VHSGEVLNLLTVRNFEFLELNIDRMVKKTDQKLAEIIIQKGKKYAHEGFKIIEFFRAGLLNIINIFVDYFLKNNLDNLILVV
jgi:hypothetical protein